MFEVDEQQFRQEMRDLKRRIREDPATRARYDMDGDGEVSGEEWEAAIASLRQEIAQRPGEVVTSSGAAAARALAPDPVTGSLTSCREIIVRQKVELHEAVLGWETANRYVFIDGESGLEVGGAEETGSGFGAAILRQFLGPARPLNLTIAATTDGVWVEGKRPWAMLGPLAPPQMSVSWHEGTLGTVQMVWPILLWRRYRVVNQNAGTEMFVEGKLWHPWRFPIMRGDKQVACIKKKWSGLGKEMFTDADNFILTYEDPGLSASDRLLLLATAMAIDYDFFEKGND